MSDVFLTHEELETYIASLNNGQRREIRYLMYKLAPAFISPDRPTQTAYHKLLNAAVYMYQQMAHLNMTDAES